MLNEQYLFAVRHLDYRLVRVRYLFDPFIFYVWGQITLNGNFRKSVPICFNGTEIQCRGQVWWKSAIAKLPKSRLELLTKKLRLRGTRPSPHFAANEPKISWTLSPLNLYMSTTLVRIDWGLPELFPVHEYHILSGLTGDWPAHEYHIRSGLTGDCRSYFLYMSTTFCPDWLGIAGVISERLIFRTPKVITIYTVSQKKLCIFIFVITSSNFHEF